MGAIQQILLGLKGVSSNYFGSGADGDTTISVNTNLSSSTDGDMIVKNFNNLTVDSGVTLTTSNRCKGLLIYVNGNLVVNGTISMTARGAAVNPESAGVSTRGLRVIRKKSGSSQTLSATDLAGCGSAATTAEAFQSAISSNGKIFTIARRGANGGAAVTDGGGGGVNASQGSDGSTGRSGGGSSGAARFASGPSGRGGNGTCFSGGSGGGATNDAQTAGVTSGDDNGGAGGNKATSAGSAGGGAGNPAGTGFTPQNGTGGLLIIIVQGDVTVGASGVISADGMLGGSAQASGGSSGGGNILIIRAGSYTNSGSVRANGGATPGSLGARGGNGSVQTEVIDL